MKWLRIGVKWLLLPALAVVLLVLFLLFTTVGARMVALVAEAVVEPLKITGLDGSIAYGLRAEQVVWSQPEVTVTLSGMASVWDPQCFWNAKVCIRSLVGGHLLVDVPHRASADSESDTDSVTPIPMPLLVFPGHLRIDRFYLAELVVEAGGRTTRVDPISFAAEWSGTRVTVERFQAATVDPDIGNIDAQIAGVIEMQSEWPFTAVASADYIPPVSGWHSQHLELSGDGNIRNLFLKAAAKAKVQLPKMEPLELAANVATQALDSEIQLQELHGQWQGAPLFAKGGLLFSREAVLQFRQMQVQWGENKAYLNGSLREDWNVEAELTLTEPQLIAPDARGQLTGKANISGLRADPLFEVQLASAALSLPQLQLNSLTLNGRVAPVSFATMEVQLDATTLQWQEEAFAEVSAQLRGNAKDHQLKLHARQGDRMYEAQAQGALNVAQMQWKGRINELQLQLENNWQIQLEQPVVVQWNQPKKILQWDYHCLKDESGKVCSQARLDLPREAGVVQLDIEQFNLNHLRPILMPERSLQGVINAHLKLSDTLARPTINGDLAIAQLSLGSSAQNSQLFEHGNIASRFEGQYAMVSADLDLPPGLHWQSEEPVKISWKKAGLRMKQSCWQATRLATENLSAADLGNVCVALDAAERGGVAVMASLNIALAPALQPWLPPELLMEGNLIAQGNAHIKGREVEADIDAEIGGGQLVLERDNKQAPLHMPFDALRLQASLHNETLKSDVVFNSAQLGQGTATAQVQIQRENPTLQLQADLRDFNVEILQPLLPQLSELQGKVDVNVDASGPFTTPAINGVVALKNFQVQSIGVPIEINDLDAKLAFTGDQGKLTGTLRSGKGKASLRGTLARTQSGWQSTVHLKGRNIPVYQPPDVRFMLQPDLTLIADQESIRLEGNVLANDGFLVLKPLPVDAVGVSPDVEFLDAQETPLQARMTIPLGMNVTASVEPSLRIRGFGGEARPKGAVQVSLDRSGIFIGRGTIDIEEGSYTGYGQQLTVRKGQLIFNGPLNQPYLNLEAIRQVETVVAGIRVTGPASEPSATLFSEPSLSDSQILYYLITGKAPGTGTEDENTAVRNALISLGLMGGQPLARDIASKVGIDDLQMATSGSGETTAITVSGYLNARTYLQYGMSVFDAANTLTVRYRLRKNLFLEAVSGIASALDVLYSFEF